MSKILVKNLSYNSFILIFLIITNYFSGKLIKKIKKINNNVNENTNNNVNENENTNNNVNENENTNRVTLPNEGLNKLIKTNKIMMIVSYIFIAIMLIVNFYHILMNIINK